MDCTQHVTERRVLFQGGSTWSGNWHPTSSNVVGGISYARLDHYTHLSQSEFHGWLDRRSVDPTAFAAIHTMGTENHWDISGYDALELNIGQSDGKIYNVMLEDERPFAWKGSFRALNVKGLPGSQTRVIRLSQLEPTRLHDELLEPLDLHNIKGFGIWIRNADSTQEGSFSLNLHAIGVVKLPCSCPTVLDTLSEAQQDDGRHGVRMRVRVAIRTMRDALTRLGRRKPENTAVRRFRVS